MAKKFHITDEDGNSCIVEEVEEAIKETADAEEEPSSENVLTSDEVTALKALAAAAPEILALIKAEKAEETAQEEMTDECESDKNPPDKEKDIEDADEDADEDEEDEDKETVVDTDCDCESSMKDSVGSIDKQTSVDDSIDAQSAIADAWNKRYNGGAK